MIRLLHTSDWHLGRLLYGKSLLEDQEFVLNRLLELIDRIEPDALLIAGDVFDRPTPPEAAVALFDRFLKNVILKQRKPVFLIPGNHDSCERLGFASSLLRDQGLTIFAKTEDSLTPAVLKSQNGEEIQIYGIPYVEPALISALLQKPELKSHDQALRALCNQIQATSEHNFCQRPAILLCHAFVTGGESSDSERDLNIGGSSQVDVAAFKGFAYTALGHLHKPQRAGHETVRYSGSLLPYSKSEVGHKKSITEVRISPDGTVNLEFHQLPTLRNLKYVEGTIEDLLSPEPSSKIGEPQTEIEQNDYVIAGLTNESPVLDAFSRLRSLYPNLLHVSRVGGFHSHLLPALDRNGNGDAAKAAERREREQMSDLDLFADFFLQTTGNEMSQQERNDLIETIRALDISERGQG
jgi:exonuclease SbcD